MGPKAGRKSRSKGRFSGRSALTRFVAFAAAFFLPAPALASFGNGLDPSWVTTALVVGGVSLALAAGLWALAEHRTAARLRRSLKSARALLRAAVGERDALLAAGREALLVWGRDRDMALTYGGSEALLDSCLAGDDAAELGGALTGLSERGQPFALVARDRQARRVNVRGRAVGGMAAVWLAPELVVTTPSQGFLSVLDALPFSVWLRDRKLFLTWANKAFISAVGATSLATARSDQAALERSERDLAATARTRHQTVEAKRFAVIAGHRRALAISEIPIENLGVIGCAIDVTELSAAEARLQQHIDAHSDTLDQLATAVAIFDRDRNLSFYNRAFAQLWDLAETWLDAHPSDGEILDRLREARKLPEQRDYQQWKRGRLAPYDNHDGQVPEELWHVPGGKTLRVVAQPHPFGGLTYLYEDVTERLALESSYNTLMKVQSATLDTLQEGVAVFGLDGRLKLYNAAFSRIWTLQPRDLAGEPHVRSIAAACADKYGDATMWERLIQSIVSGAASKRDLGEIERNDRVILALALAPLPDGATLVTFADVSDRFRIEAALRERNEALEAADRLKSDFIKHVSYELRTPLNTILGFAEHLSSEIPGALSQRQREYLDAIVSGANSLKDLVSDILDLALIESGALRLELERIDLHEMISEVAARARDWASKAGLALQIECPDDAGQFLGDSRRLRQVTFNLLSNAFKYTPRGGTITLGGAIHGEDVQIYVADNGPGIAQEVKANVFDRFAAKSRSGQRAGAGLGLALVNRFIELHDGWVELESDNGTIVRCHLPRRIHGGEPDTNRDRRVA
jgi:signal transduction histidine kinase